MMTEAGYLQAKRMNPGALATALAIEGAIIAAAVMWQVDAIKKDPPIVIDTTWVPTETAQEPAEESKPKPDRQPQSQPQQTIFAEIPVVDVPPLGGGLIDTSDSDTGTKEGVATGTVDGPLIVEQPRIEPARAKGNIRSLITADDYPEAARRSEETGTVRARLDIDASGRVGGCTVIASSGSKLLDATTCKVLKARARFTPAKDGSGQAVADSYVTPQIVWRLDG